MTTTLKQKYIGDRSFYRMVLRIAVPVMVQNGITNFVNLLDNIMVGQVGTEPMSGVAIVNQFVFVYNLAVFGIQSGAGIYRQIDRLMAGKFYRIIEGEEPYDFVYASCPFHEGTRIQYE